MIKIHHQAQSFADAVVGINDMDANNDVTLADLVDLANMNAVDADDYKRLIARNRELHLKVKELEGRPTIYGHMATVQEAFVAGQASVVGSCAQAAANDPQQRAANGGCAAGAAMSNVGAKLFGGLVGQTAPVPLPNRLAAVYKELLDLRDAEEEMYELAGPRARESVRAASDALAPVVAPILARGKAA